MKALFARLSVLRPIKPGHITKEFLEEASQFRGTFHGLKVINYALIIQRLISGYRIKLQLISHFYRIQLSLDSYSELKRRN